MVARASAVRAVMVAGFSMRCWLLIDATVIRAQAQAGGTRVKGAVAQAQALGRSRGGFGTKIHAVVDALGLPIRFILGSSRQNDMALACDPYDRVAYKP